MQTTDNPNRNFGFSLLLLLGLLGGLGDLTGLTIGLLNGLDDTDSDGLTHVTDGESTERWVLLVRLDTHWLGWDHLDDGSVTTLDELGGSLHNLTRSPVDLLDEFSELACDMSGVAIEDWCVTSTDLTWVVKNDDLSVERSSFLGWVVLGVGANVSTTDIFDGNVLDVETDVVSWETLNELLVVHLDGLDFGGNVGWSKVDDHTSLDDTGLYTTDWYRTDTTDLVNVLERETEGLVGRSDGGLDGIDGLEEGLSLDDTGLGLLGPSLVPGHVGGLLQHVITVPTRDWDESNRFRVVSDLLDETRSLLDDLVEPIL